MTARLIITPRDLRAGDNVRMDSRDGTSAWAHVVDVLSPQRLIVDPVRFGAERVIVRGVVSHVDGIGHTVKVASVRGAAT